MLIYDKDIPTISLKREKLPRQFNKACFTLFNSITIIYDSNQKHTTSSLFSSLRPLTYDNNILNKYDKKGCLHPQHERQP